ncbi:unnamed protein product [Cutaneotrichosporon oleaginosum]
MSKKIDLSLFRGDDSDDEIGLLPLKRNPVELDPLKSRTFAHGVTKKTKKDLEREEEERKRAEEEAFVPVASAPMSASADPRVARPSIDRERERTAEQFRLPSPPPAPKPRGKRAMDAFLEEIKSNQEARDARYGRMAQSEGTSVTALAAYDRGRQVLQETTNLCVSNLPSSVHERELGLLFAQMGPVATIKIMWPRAGSDTQPTDRFKPGLTGFVAFMARKDAAGALARFDGYSLNGNRLRVTWAKPVQLPRHPAYGELNQANARAPRLDSSGSRDGRSGRSSRGRSQSPAGEQQTAITADFKRQHWVDQVSADELKFVEEVSKRIRDIGPGLLDTLKDREQDNPKFQFLFDQESAVYHVFQHLLDAQYEFPDPPPPSFKEDGYASAYSSDSDEREEIASTSKVSLGVLAKRRLEAMLRVMSGKRVEIARAMEFSLKRADAYEAVTEIICLSLCVEATPIPRKIARLHLVSDILHNSSSSLPNVWRYRQSFERRLPAVFEHFAIIHSRLREYSSTMSANVFIQQVDAVLDIWEGWMVLTAEIQNRLRKLLHGECTLASLAEPQALNESEPEPKPIVKSAGFKSSFKRVDPLAATAAPHVSVATSVTEDLDGEPVEDLDGEELDGEPIDFQDGGSGEPFEDVDGEPVDVDDVTTVSIGTALDGEDGEDGEDMEIDIDDE